MQCHNFYVLTGGPGVGKTSLINELQRRSYPVVPEIARELIKEQEQSGGLALPWKDRESYKELMFERSLNSFKQAAKHFSGKQAVFFDRGFLDSLAYARLIQSPQTDHLEEAAQRFLYHPSVFILPPWPEIYTQDQERKQNWEEVIATHQQMMKTYEQVGYQLIEVPRIAVSERADFILKRLSNEQANH